MNDIITLIKLITDKNWRAILILIAKMLPTIIEIIAPTPGSPEIMRQPVSSRQILQQYEDMTIPQLQFQLQEQVNAGILNNEIVKMILIALLKRLGGF